MKLTADAESLGVAISALARMVPTNSLFPIVGSIKLATGTDSLILSGTNMDCLASVTVPANIIEPGEAAIEAERLNAFINKMSGAASFDAGPQQATLKCGRRTAKLAVLPAGDFPDIPFEGDTTYGMDLTGEAVSTIADLAFAAATKDTRPFLQGVHIFTRSGNLVVEAGDGMIFVQFTIDLRCTIPIEWSIIIPRDTLPILKRFFPDGCKLRLSTSKLEASNETTRFVSKLMQGPYPLTERVIPQPSPEWLSIICDADELIRAATQIVAIAGAEQNWFTLFPRADHVLLSATTKADAEDAINGECSGTISQLTLSSRIFCPLLEGLKASTVRMTQAASGAPIRIDAIGHDDRVGAVMPVLMQAQERKDAA